MRDQERPSLDDVIKAYEEFNEWLYDSLWYLLVMWIIRPIALGLFAMFLFGVLIVLGIREGWERSTRERIPPRPYPDILPRTCES